MSLCSSLETALSKINICSYATMHVTAKFLESNTKQAVKVCHNRSVEYYNLKHSCKNKKRFLKCDILLVSKECFATQGMSVGLKPAWVLDELQRHGVCTTSGLMPNHCSLTF